MLWAIQRRLHLWDLSRRVRRHGWTGVHVPGGPDRPSWSYSVGFPTAASAPEIIIFGADAATADALLAQAHDQLSAGDLSLKDKADWELDWGDEQAPRLAWRAVHPSQIRREHFNAAIIHHERRGRGREDLQCFQLFVSDPQGKLPWEDGFDFDHLPKQPELYLPYFGPDRD